MIAVDFSRYRHSIWLAGIVIVLMLAPACARDQHQRRVETMKEHIKSFYSDLRAGREASAIAENERIEAMAVELGETIKRRVNQPGANQGDRDWVVLRSAREAAAENWLALARYFTAKSQYEKARATYTRVLETYTGDLDRAYAERAQAGVRDLQIMRRPTP